MSANIRSSSMERLFRPTHRLRRVLSASWSTLWALLLLYIAISLFAADSPELSKPWWNSWWVVALFLLAYTLVVVDRWNDVFFTKLVLSEKGISFSRLGRKRYIAWEEVEQVGVISSRRDGEYEYGFILRALRDNRRKRFTWFEKIRAAEVISLNMFVDEWFVSDLRNEIKQLQPLLPVK